MTEGSISPGIGYHPPAHFKPHEDESPSDEFLSALSSQSGKGAAQGTSVAIGSGLAAKALHEDAQLSRELTGNATDPVDVDDSVFYDFEEDADLNGADAPAPDKTDWQARLDAALAHDAGDDLWQELDAGTEEPVQGQTDARAPITEAEEHHAAGKLRQEMPPALPHGTASGGQHKAELVVNAGLGQERNAAEAQVQQQGGYGASLWNGLGALLTGADSFFNQPKLSSAPDESPVFPKPALLGSEKTEVAKTQTPRTAARKEVAEAKAEVIAIGQDLHKLNNHVRIAAGAPVIPRNPDLLDPQELSVWDTVWRLKHATCGSVAALQSTLGTITVALAAPAVACAVSPLLGPVGGYALRWAAYTGAAYLCVKTFREVPELATNHQVLGMIDETLKSVAPKLEKLKELQAAELSRLNVETRMVMVGDAGAQKISGLRSELENVGRAMHAARNGNVSSMDEFLSDALTTPQKAVTLSGGGLRAQTLDMAGRAKAAFSALFTPIANVLSRMYQFFSGARSTALQQERDYAQSIKPTLDALQASGDAKVSLVHKWGLEVAAMQRANHAGVEIDYPTSRKQFIMGENLTRALRAANEPHFGVMAYDGGELHGGRRAVSATLTTARAIAWYLDAIADLRAEARKQFPDAPQVKRNPDGSLSVPDPDRKIASFLMSVPVAYTGMMAGQEGDHPSAALTIDDPSWGMPGGMHGMQFESVLDEAGQTGELRLSFTAESGRPVYSPLANERQMLDKLKVAQHTASAPPRALTQDYSNWSMEKLQQHSLALEKQLEREIATTEANNNQLEALHAWNNPRSMVNRA